MSEPTEADRAIFKAAYARVVAANDGCIPTYADEHEFVALQAIGAARMEERAELARLAQSEEMVEKIVDRVYGPILGNRYAEETVQVLRLYRRDHLEEVRKVLAALFCETGVCAG